MKKIILLIALLGGVCFQSEAQSWTDMLKGLFGGSTTTEEKAPATTQSSMTLRQLAKSWTYEKAVVEYTGDDALAAMAVGVLADQVEQYCAKAGIVAGRDRIVFLRNGQVRIYLGEKLGSGNFRYNQERGEITITVRIDDKSASLTGQVRYDGDHLTLLFPADKALQTMKSAVPSLAENEYVKIAENLISSYPGVLIGARF